MYSNVHVCSDVAGHSELFDIPLLVHIAGMEIKTS